MFSALCLLCISLCFSWVQSKGSVGSGLTLGSDRPLFGSFGLCLVWFAGIECIEGTQRSTKLTLKTKSDWYSKGLSDLLRKKCRLFVSINLLEDNFVELFGALRVWVRQQRRNRKQNLLNRMFSQSTTVYMSSPTRTPALMQCLFTCQCKGRAEAETDSQTQTQTELGLRGESALTVSTIVCSLETKLAIKRWITD